MFRFVSVYGALVAGFKEARIRFDSVIYRLFFSRVTRVRHGKKLLPAERMYCLFIHPPGYDSDWFCFFYFVMSMGSE